MSDAGDQPVLPFKYVGGDVALDLVNTVDWTDDGLVDERLDSYARFTEWAEGAGVLSARDGAALRARAVADPEQADTVLGDVQRLRGAVQAIVAGIAAGEPVGEALDEVNEALADALTRLRLVPGSGRGDASALDLTWDGWGEALEAPLWPVLRAAANLLATESPDRIRVCGGPRCGWVFVDRSRNGLRRWCQTDVCGAQAKARRHYARKRAATRSADLA
jgi:predicted RNA-binding Zn ribbon-like protein